MLKENCVDFGLYDLFIYLRWHVIKKLYKSTDTNNHFFIRKLHGQSIG